MRSWKLILAIVVVLSCATVVVSQAAKDDSAKANAKPMTRLAYRGSVQPYVCLAVNQDGDYLMWRSTSPRSATKGKLQPDQRRRFSELMRQAQGLAGSGAILVHKQARVLVAETPDGQKPQRRVWVTDTDGENPFPEPVEKIAQWLQGLQLHGTTEAVTGKRDVCPSGDLKPLQ